MWFIWWLSSYCYAHILHPTAVVTVRNKSSPSFLARGLLNHSQQWTVAVYCCSPPRAELLQEEAGLIFPRECQAYCMWSVCQLVSAMLCRAGLLTSLCFMWADLPLNIRHRPSDSLESYHFLLPWGFGRLQGYGTAFPFFPERCMHKMLFAHLFVVWVSGSESANSECEHKGICRALLLIRLLPCDIHSQIKVQIYQFFGVINSSRFWRWRCGSLHVCPAMSSRAYLCVGFVYHVSGLRGKIAFYHLLNYFIFTAVMWGKSSSYEARQKDYALQWGVVLCYTWSLTAGCCWNVWQCPSVPWIAVLHPVKELAAKWLQGELPYLADSMGRDRTCSTPPHIFHLLTALPCTTATHLPDPTQGKAGNQAAPSVAACSYAGLAET